MYIHRKGAAGHSNMALKVSFLLSVLMSSPVHGNCYQFKWLQLLLWFHFSVLRQFSQEIVRSILSFLVLNFGLLFIIWFLKADILIVETFWIALGAIVKCLQCVAGLRTIYQVFQKYQKKIEKIEIDPYLLWERKKFDRPSSINFAPLNKVM